MLRELLISSSGFEYMNRNFPIVTTNLTLCTQNNSTGRNGISNKNMNQDDVNFKNLINVNNSNFDENNNESNNNNWESLSKLVKKNSYASVKKKKPSIIKEEFIYSINNKNRNRKKSKKFGIRTKSITRENKSIDNYNFDSNISNNNNIQNKNSCKNLEDSKEAEYVSDQSQIENALQPNKRRVISKFYRSSTFNFTEKPDLNKKISENPFAQPSKKSSKNNLSVLSTNYNNSNNNNNNLNIHNQNNIYNYNSNSNNLGFFRKNSFFNTSTDFNNNYNNNNDPNPTNRGSQNERFLSDQSLMFKQPSEGTYEAFIYKYDQKKEKIIPNFILLNSKMILYLKSDCKSSFRGRHYLSDVFAKVTYDKTQNIISNGIRYFYINLNIKGLVKWFVSKTEFEMR